MEEGSLKHFDNIEKFPQIPKYMCSQSKINGLSLISMLLKQNTCRSDVKQPGVRSAACPVFIGTQVPIRTVVFQGVPV